MPETTIETRLLLERPGFTLDVDLSLPGTGVTVLFGHSGCGKTTFLRCVAGLERAGLGRVRIKGETWQDEGQFVPVHKRSLAYVFQEASLFEHLSARENLQFAVRRAARKASRLTLDDTVQLLGIGHLLGRRPCQLSGGERQRVAIARALLACPDLLLLDEPLASLDHQRKQEILPYLETLKAELDVPILYVTHAPDEVARLADYLVAMDSGRAIAAGTLGETLNSLDFPIPLGEETGAVVGARVSARDREWHLAKLTFPGGELWSRDHGHPVGAGVRVRILARDISLSLMHAAESSIVNALPARIEEIVDDDHPALALITLRIGSETNASTLIARVTRRSVHNLDLTPGKSVWAQIKSVAIVE